MILQWKNNLKYAIAASSIEPKVLVAGGFMITESMGSIKDKLKSKVTGLENKIVLKKYKVDDFVPKEFMEEEKGPYVLRTAQNPEELKNCLKLRYRVFYNELLNKKTMDKYDIDEMDLICDHVFIRVKETGQLVGTYRVNSSTHSKVFYSSQEFFLDEVLALEGEKLELGRACIDANHRNGQVMDLLWRGISRYSIITGCSYMFGCTSIKSESVESVAKLAAFFNQKNWLFEGVYTPPRPKYAFQEFNDKYAEALKLPSEELLAAKKLLPSLFLGYIKAGAKVCIPPAHDKSFKCTDFLTICDLTRLNKAHAKRYFSS